MATKQLEVSREYVTNELVPQHAESLMVFGITPKKFAAAVCECFLKNPAIHKCEQKSLIAALRVSCMWGLPPDGRLAAVVPYKNKQGHSIATFLPMKDGLLKMIMRAFPKAHIESGLINACDEYTWSGGDDAAFSVQKRIPTTKEQKKIIAAWCRMRLEDGRTYLEVMDAMDLENAKSASKAKTGDSPWNKWYGSMCEKSVIKKLMNRLVYMIEADEIRDAYTQSLEQDSDFEKPEVEVRKPVVIEAEAQVSEINQGESLVEVDPDTMKPKETKTTKTTRKTTKKEPKQAQAEVIPEGEPDPAPPAEAEPAEVEHESPLSDPDEEYDPTAI